MVVAIQKELGLPIKFIGLGEKLEDLQPFDGKQFAQALFEE
jgi:fused signal recognition particle receptor